MLNAACLNSLMLLKEFYTILNQSGPESETTPSGISTRYSFTIELNPEHPVYQGHFSGNPVVPGVCQVQIISELLSIIKGFPLRLVSADNVKFLSLMVPKKNRIAEALIQLKQDETGLILANAILQKDEVVFIKFKGKFRKDEN
jgi:3-hydroxyacyl-[acyl-carrier-protein] dehydratase